MRPPPAACLEILLSKTPARLLLAARVLTLAAAAWATPAWSEGFTNDPAVQEFIAVMADQHGFNAAVLEREFAAITPNEAVLRAIAPAAAPESQRSWQRYRPRFVNPRRIAEGVRFWRANEATLARARSTFGVPEEVIVAIIGVETEYGRNAGRFLVLEALATLAFRYPPRAEFFRGELEQFLLLARENDLSPLSIRGSYAGAIGIPQFMPGSQRRFAVDFDGDGRIDLGGTPADAIGSVASFLAQHGWKNGEPVAVPARVSSDADITALLAAGLRPQASVADLAAKGIAGHDEVPPDLAATLIDLASPGLATEYWLGFDNFYALTRYNRSTFYAMSVFQLSQAVLASRSSPPVRTGYRRKHRRGG